MELTVLYWILVAVMVVGVVGAVVPGIPGPSLILVAILLWCIVTKFAIPLLPLGLIFVALLLSSVVEWLGSYWGAKQIGASRWSQMGMFIGMAIGFFGLLPALPLGGPIAGILVGGLLGGFIGEFLYRSDLPTSERLRTAGRVTLGIGFGALIGNLIELVLAIAAVAVFVWVTLPSVMWT
ncbi:MULTISPECIES: DUF456 domain-containing protein [Leptolyngbya]|jgi:uncharacterized protein YqgC (DUF456 family)|uniref:DUF456 domain-containing protein n=2 Tax=Leptolyngbya boryana TaxID=1184 RepID=A0A1Z4JHJ9_LEPBY|nr:MULTISPECIES: DUF456 domain-containing protein [Leptolyngbya]BAY56211.1 hypothetical protein NIES2135_30410 [Leptolyngbya boryana NIES-2135]MBD2366318.1 DUF456 domain-containing protein [Leptolyngbya sp. FACHB-161]MBD2372498.1 DUF456 domain-containing protein [Leptolyngbya sp. FACHB-238]MBD2396921.1 DUF456 domain-containing protein [Leptolyngbya sp. FACHB-239]MBD2403444.1 DUF456 domain-containing protein [Leptolyngbya sp. FACHB-402]